MPADSTNRSALASSRWARRLALSFLALFLLGASAYVIRRTLLLEVARIYFDRDSEVMAQERMDGVRILFAQPPKPWVKPMKNAMNPIWQSIEAEGVNYYTFAGPSNLLQDYSERSDPSSPRYQAWVGAYVTKRRDGTIPHDLPAWARSVTELDQRSWLDAMGDPAPLAVSTPPSRVGSIVVDGRARELWHGTMRSHSDLSEKPVTPLATLIGMPIRSHWPPGIVQFHDVTLDGYFVCWSDAIRRVSIVVYAVAAIPTDGSMPASVPRGDMKDELLRLMGTATVEAVR